MSVTPSHEYTLNITHKYIYIYNTTNMYVCMCCLGDEEKAGALEVYFFLFDNWVNNMIADDDLQQLLLPVQ